MTSATLTWQNSGLGTKTGTARDDFFNDLNTLVTSKAGDANFRWQVASFSIAGNPRYIVLKRKNGSDGRILIVGYTGAPAGSNTTLFDVAAGSIVTTSQHIAWFPNGNVDTPSNLAAASGTILGNDTGAVKVSTAGATSSIYAALFQHYYMESEEGIWFFTQNPAAATIHAYGAGMLIVDGTDTEHGCTLTSSLTAMGQIGTASPVFTWTTAAQTAGSTNSNNNIRTNYGSNNRTYFQGFTPTGGWAASAVSSTDILTDTANNRAWFVPIQLLGQVKGEGFVLKLRQFGLGPGTVGPFTVYNTSGPTVQARQVNALTSGGNGYPWVVNFKI